MVLFGSTLCTWPGSRRQERISASGARALLRNREFSGTGEDPAFKLKGRKRAIVPGSKFRRIGGHEDQPLARQETLRFEGSFGHAFSRRIQNNDDAFGYHRL